MYETLCNDSVGGVLCLLALLLSSCSKELFDHTEASDPKQFTGPISQWPELQRHVTQQRQKAKLRRDSSINYWDYIDLNKVIAIEDKNGLMNFTFYVNIPDVNKLTNVVVKEKVDGDYEAYLVEYVSADLRRWLDDYGDKVISSVPIEMNVSSLLTSKNMCWAWVIERYCPNGFVFGEEGCTHTFDQLSIRIVDKQVECYKSYDLAGDDGIKGGGNSSEGSSGNSGNPGYSNPPSGSSGNAPGNPPISGGSNTSSNTPPEDASGPQDANTLLTEPNEGSESSEPCNQVKENLVSNPKNRSALIQLRDPNNLTLNYEKGFQLVQDQDAPISINGPANLGGIDTHISTDGKTYGICHVHYNGTNMLPTFTFEDLVTLYTVYKVRKDANQPLDAILFTVYTRAGVFAMQIEDFSFFEQEGANLIGNNLKQLKKTYYNNMLDSDPSLDDYNVAQTSESLSKYGVGLYKSLNSSLTNWGKVTANPITNLTSINPCP